VIDGTGAAPRAVDVEIADGRICGLPERRKGASARRRVDASGMVVAPGFIDLHTHLDAQVFWDPYCTPSSLYGVTTAIGGNCGFSIAPLAEDDDGYTLRLLAEVEAIPKTTLEAGVPWNWHSFAEYLDAVAASRPAINMGFLVGHSALRRSVLGAGYAEPHPSSAGLSAMRRALGASLSAGARGFSSSWNSIHFDGDKAPVPSRHSTEDELLTLSSVVRAFPGAQLEFIPTVGRFEDRHIDLMIEMARAASAPLNWNVLIPTDEEVVRQQLAASDAAAARSARVLALTYPGPTPLRASSASARFRSLPGWAQVLDTAAHDLGVLRDRDIRERLRRSAEGGETPFSKILGAFVIADAHSPTTRPWSGSTLAELATTRATDVYDVLFDAWVADRLKTGLLPEPMANSEEGWRLRRATWTDPRVLIGASDAGAHVQMLATFDYPAVLLALAREDEMLDLPTAVRALTHVPAGLYGLRGRGIVAVGAFADLVVFDPETVGPGVPGWRDDLPGGAGRIYKEPSGIHHVIVNGVPIVGPEGLNGERPGVVLRGER